MTLFAICLNSLLHRLDQQLNGFRIQQKQHKTAVVGYADVTIMVTVPDDISVIRNAIQCYEKATGAVLNISKLQALAVRTWDTKLRVLDTPYKHGTQSYGCWTHHTMMKLTLYAPN
jgi:hypothetical protein